MAGTAGPDAMGHLSAADREFFGRVWATDPSVYRGRLEAAGFSGAGKVLDAGSGVGQWSVAMAELNAQVVGLDVDQARCAVTRAVSRDRTMGNISVVRASLDAVPLPDASVDAVWCFSAIYLAHVERALREFARVLRPGGRLYLTCNGLGYYLRNLVLAPNASAHYSPRRDAVHAIAETVSWRMAGRRHPGRPAIVGSARLRHLADRAGFDSQAAPEGTSTVGPTAGPSFFAGRFPRRFGVEACYEVMATRRAES